MNLVVSASRKWLDSDVAEAQLVVTFLFRFLFRKGSIAGPFRIGVSQQMITVDFILGWVVPVIHEPWHCEVANDISVVIPTQDRMCRYWDCVLPTITKWPTVDPELLPIYHRLVTWKLWFLITFRSARHTHKYFCDAAWAVLEFSSVHYPLQSFLTNRILRRN